MYIETLQIAHDGTRDAPIRFISDTRWGAKIAGNGDTNYAVRVDGNYVSVEGFEITNLNPKGHLGVEVDGNFDRIIGNHIHHICPFGGADKLGGAAIVNGGNIEKGYLDVIGNLVHDIGDLNFPWYQVQGIYYGSKGGNILNNIVYRTQGWGIHLWHAATDITIANNTVFDNMEGGILVGSGDYPCPPAGPGCVVDDNTRVVNNIAVFNQGHNYNGSTLGGFGILEEGVTGTHNLYENNLVYGNASGGIRLKNGLKATNTVTADPLFVDHRPAGQGDYHLQPGSPAIGGGTSNSAPAFDFDGGPRPVGKNVDIGAYEHGVSAAHWPWENH